MSELIDTGGDREFSLENPDIILVSDYDIRQLFENNPHVRQADILTVVMRMATEQVGRATEITLKDLQAGLDQAIQDGSIQT